MRLLWRLAGEARQQEGHRRSPKEHREQPAEPLTARELQVVRLLSLGGTNKQIARELGVSRTTVKTHVAHIIGKFGVSER
jgi:DNA-binding NarL/FixJ family response regulator